MAGRFASKKRAHGFCDRCNFRAPLKQLRRLTINEKVVNLLVCDECWEPDHPQYRIGRVNVEDPQALRDPRPDPALEESRELT